MKTPPPPAPPRLPLSGKSLADLLRTVSAHKKTKINATWSRSPFEIEYSYADDGRTFFRDKRAGKPAIGAEVGAVKESFIANFDLSTDELASISQF